MNSNYLFPILRFKKRLKNTRGEEGAMSGIQWGVMVTWEPPEQNDKTDTCKNITFPQIFAGGNYRSLTL